MLSVNRKITLDLAMVIWGLGTWLGSNGMLMQLPLLVQRLPEGWALSSFTAMAAQVANIGVVLYVLFKRLVPRIPDSIYIYSLLAIGTLALALNGFFYMETVNVGGSERSVAFIALTFFAAFLGCTSSVLFYPYMRYYRDIYLPTYLVGEGLSGLIPSILALIQGVGGDPECILLPDNSTVQAIFPPPRFDTKVFLLVLAALSALSMVCFAFVDRWDEFQSERVTANKAEVTAPQRMLLQPNWVTVLVMMAVLNALIHGAMPSLQSFSCMPYGSRAYHLAMTLGVMTNPIVCLAGVWLRPLGKFELAGLLTVAVAPFMFILATALYSPAPLMQDRSLGEIFVVLSWVFVSASISYARMWVYDWARRGGALGMRAAGVATQVGALSGSLLLFLLVNYTHIFTQYETCSVLAS